MLHREFWGAIDPNEIIVNSKADNLVINNSILTQFKQSILPNGSKELIVIDPGIYKAKQILTSTKTTFQEGGILFYYNGHGVRPPTPLRDINGDLKGIQINFFEDRKSKGTIITTKTIVDDLVAPFVGIFDVSNAGYIIEDIKRRIEYNRAQKILSQNSDDNRRDKVVIVIGACGKDEVLPSKSSIPPDLLTCCLTTPLAAFVYYYIKKSHFLDIDPLTAYKLIPGDLKNTQTPLGELEWILRTILEAIAWSLFDHIKFYDYFGQKSHLKSILCNYFVAQKVLGYEGLTPQIYPEIPDVSSHPLWQDMEDMIMYFFTNQSLQKRLVRLMKNNQKGLCEREQTEENFFPFLKSQLKGLAHWMNLPYPSRRPPHQLPIVKNMLFTDILTEESMLILSRYFDLGRNAINEAMSLSIDNILLFYISGKNKEHIHLMIFIYAKLIAAFPFLTSYLINKALRLSQKTPANTLIFSIIQKLLEIIIEVSTPPDERALTLFLLYSVLCVYDIDDLKSRFSQLRIEYFIVLLNSPYTLARCFSLLCLSKLLINEESKKAFLENKYYKHIKQMSFDASPEVRGCSLVCISSVINEIPPLIIMDFINLSFDPSPLVRREALYLVKKIIISNFDPFLLVVVENCALSIGINVGEVLNKEFIELLEKEYQEEDEISSPSDDITKQTNNTIQTPVIGMGDKYPESSSLIPPDTQLTPSFEKHGIATPSMRSTSLVSNNKMSPLSYEVESEIYNEGYQEGQSLSTGLVDSAPELDDQSMIYNYNQNDNLCKTTKKNNQNKGKKLREVSFPSLKESVKSFGRTRSLYLRFIPKVGEVKEEFNGILNVLYNILLSLNRDPIPLISLLATEIVRGFKSIAWLIISGLYPFNNSFITDSSFNNFSDLENNEKKHLHSNQRGGQQQSPRNLGSRVNRLLQYNEITTDTDQSATDTCPIDSDNSCISPGKVRGTITTGYYSGDNINNTQRHGRGLGNVSRIFSSTRQSLLRAIDNAGSNMEKKQISSSSSSSTSYKSSQLNAPKLRPNAYPVDEVVQCDYHCRIPFSLYGLEHSNSLVTLDRIKRKLIKHSLLNHKNTRGKDESLNIPRKELVKKFHCSKLTKVLHPTELGALILGLYRFTTIGSNGEINELLHFDKDSIIAMKEEYDQLTNNMSLQSKNLKNSNSGRLTENSAIMNIRNYIANEMEKMELNDKVFSDVINFSALIYNERITNLRKKLIKYLEVIHPATPPLLIKSLNTPLLSASIINLSAVEADIIRKQSTINMEKLMRNVSGVDSLYFGSRFNKPVINITGSDSQRSSKGDYLSGTVESARQNRQLTALSPSVAQNILYSPTVVGEHDNGKNDIDSVGRRPNIISSRDERARERERRNSGGTNSIEKNNLSQNQIQEYVAVNRLVNDIISTNDVKTGIGLSGNIYQYTSYCGIGIFSDKIKYCNNKYPKLFRSIINITKKNKNERCQCGRYSIGRLIRQHLHLYIRKFKSVDIRNSLYNYNINTGNISGLSYNSNSNIINSRSCDNGLYSFEPSPSTGTFSSVTTNSGMNLGGTDSINRIDRKNIKVLLARNLTIGSPRDLDSSFWEKRCTESRYALVAKKMLAATFSPFRGIKAHVFAEYKRDAFQLDYQNKMPLFGIHFQDIDPKSSDKQFKKYVELLDILSSSIEPPFPPLTEYGTCEDNLEDYKTINDPYDKTTKLMCRTPCSTLSRTLYHSCYMIEDCSMIYSMNINRFKENKGKSSNHKEKKSDDKDKKFSFNKIPKIDPISVPEPIYSDINTKKCGNKIKNYTAFLDDVRNEIIRKEQEHRNLINEMQKKLQDARNTICSGQDANVSIPSGVNTQAVTNKIYNIAQHGRVQPTGIKIFSANKVIFNNSSKFSTINSDPVYADTDNSKLSNVNNMTNSSNCVVTTMNPGTNFRGVRFSPNKLLNSQGGGIIRSGIDGTAGLKPTIHFTSNIAAKLMSRKLNDRSNAPESMQEAIKANLQVTGSTLLNKLQLQPSMKQGQLQIPGIPLKSEIRKLFPGGPENIGDSGMESGVLNGSFYTLGVLPEQSSYATRIKQLETPVEFNCLNSSGHFLKGGRIKIIYAGSMLTSICETSLQINKISDDSNVSSSTNTGSQQQDQCLFIKQNKVISEIDSNNYIDKSLNGRIQQLSPVSSTDCLSTTSTPHSISGSKMGTNSQAPSSTTVSIENKRDTNIQKQSQQKANRNENKQQRQQHEAQAGSSSASSAQTFSKKRKIYENKPIRANIDFSESKSVPIIGPETIETFPDSFIAGMCFHPTRPLLITVERVHSTHTVNKIKNNLYCNYGGENNLGNNSFVGDGNGNSQQGKYSCFTCDTPRSSIQNTYFDYGSLFSSPARDNFQHQSNNFNTSQNKTKNEQYHIYSDIIGVHNIRYGNMNGSLINAYISSSAADIDNVANEKIYHNIYSSPKSTVSVSGSGSKFGDSKNSNSTNSNGYNSKPTRIKFNRMDGITVNCFYDAVGQPMFSSSQCSCNGTQRVTGYGYGDACRSPADVNDYNISQQKCQPEQKQRQHHQQQQEYQQNQQNQTRQLLESTLFPVPYSLHRHVQQPLPCPTCAYTALAIGMKKTDYLNYNNYKGNSKKNSPGHSNQTTLGQGYSAIFGNCGDFSNGTQQNCRKTEMSSGLFNGIVSSNIEHCMINANSILLRHRQPFTIAQQGGNTNSTSHFNTTPPTSLVPVNTSSPHSVLLVGCTDGNIRVYKNYDNVSLSSGASLVSAWYVGNGSANNRTNSISGSTPSAYVEGPWESYQNLIDFFDPLSLGENSLISSNPLFQYPELVSGYGSVYSASAELWQAERLSSIDPLSLLRTLDNIRTNNNFNKAIWQLRNSRKTGFTGRMGSMQGNIQDRTVLMSRFAKNRIFAAYREPEIMSYDCTRETRIGVFNTHVQSRFTYVDSDENGNLLYCGTENGEVLTCDVRENVVFQKVNAHQSRILAVGYNNNTNNIVSISSNGIAKLVDIRRPSTECIQLRCLDSTGHTAKPVCASIHRHSGLISYGTVRKQSQNSVMCEIGLLTNALLPFASIKLSDIMQNDSKKNYWITNVTWHPINNILAIASASSNRSYTSFLALESSSDNIRRV